MYHIKIEDMKTPMELALARIELMKDISPDSIHWQMFKDNYIHLEKLMMIDKQIELYNQLNTLGLLLPNSIGFELEQLKNNL
jgi:hypothetical protein